MSFFESVECTDPQTDQSLITSGSTPTLAPINDNASTSGLNTASGSSIASGFNHNSESDEDEDMCNICYGGADQPTRPNCCSHIFCRTCIVTWSNRSNTCPLDRLKFNELKVLKFYDPNADVVESVTVKDSDMVDDDIVSCAICRRSDREEILLLCDHPNHAYETVGYHTTCIGLDSVPTDDHWFCPDCVSTHAEASSTATTSRSSPQMQPARPRAAPRSNHQRSINPTIAASRNSATSRSLRRREDVGRARTVQSTSTTSIHFHSAGGRIGGRDRARRFVEWEEDNSGPSSVASTTRLRSPLRQSRRQLLESIRSSRSRRTKMIDCPRRWRKLPENGNALWPGVDPRCNDCVKLHTSIQLCRRCTQRKAALKIQAKEKRQARMQRLAQRHQRREIPRPPAPPFSLDHALGDVESLRRKSAPKKGINDALLQSTPTEYPVQPHGKKNELNIKGSAECRIQNSGHPKTSKPEISCPVTLLDQPSSRRKESLSVLAAPVTPPEIGSNTSQREVESVHYTVRPMRQLRSSATKDIESRHPTAKRKRSGREVKPEKQQQIDIKNSKKEVVKLVRKALDPYYKSKKIDRESYKAICKNTVDDIVRKGLVNMDTKTVVELIKIQVSNTTSN